MNLENFLQNSICKQVIPLNIVIATQALFICYAILFKSILDAPLPLATMIDDNLANSQNALLKQNDKMHDSPPPQNIT